MAQKARRAISIEMSKPTTIYYDGKCGLCRREIAYYARIAPSGAFVWRDIATDPAPLTEIGVSQADALMYLHARLPDGEVVTGVEVFTTIWSKLPYWRRLVPLSRLSLIHGALEWGYGKFARWRFGRYTHCDLAANESAAPT